MNRRPVQTKAVGFPFWIAAIVVLIAACDVVWWAAILIVLLANFKLILRYR